MCWSFIQGGLGLRENVFILNVQVLRDTRRRRGRPHTETVFSYQSKLANGQFVLGHVAPDTTVQETSLHFVRSRQAAQLQLP